MLRDASFATRNVPVLRDLAKRTKGDGGATPGVHFASNGRYYRITDEPLWFVSSFSRGKQETRGVV